MKHNVGKVILGVVSALLLTLMIKGPEVSAQDLRTKAEIEATKDWGYQYKYIPVGTKEELISALTSGESGIEPQVADSKTVTVGTYVYLTNDIDLAGMEWKSKPIEGVFDGNGHVIRNLKVHCTDQDDKWLGAGGGLFSRAYQGTVVRNLGLESVDITADYTVAGGIIGKVGYGGYVFPVGLKIENCFVTGKINAKQYPGGIIGTIETAPGSAPIIIQGCLTDVLFQNNNTFSGGIVGSCTYSRQEQIKNCLIWGGQSENIHGYGGIMGDGSINCIENCVVASPNYYEAIFGRDNRNVVTNCYYNNKVPNSGVRSLEESKNNTHPINEVDLNNQASYSGLDFTNVWGIDSAINNGVIFLRKIPFAYALSPIQITATDNSNGSKRVSINCGASGATIYYTTDGTTPTVTSNKYTGSFECWGTKQIQAIAVLGCYKPSPVATVTVQAIEKPDGKIDSSTGGTSINGTVAKPKANYSSRSSLKNLKVKLTTSTKGATIYYTTNGKTPTTASKKYTKTITIKKNTTLKVIAVKDGYARSKVATYKYKIVKPKVTSQTYNKNKTQKTVKLKCALSKTIIYYTTNGKKPTKSSKKYNQKKGIILTKNTTIKYIAVREKQISDVCSTKIYYQVPTPKASKPSSTIKKGTKITLSTSLKGARIYYTLNGKKPTTKSKIYKKLLVIKQDTKLQYIAVRKGIKSSKVVTTIYKVK